MAEDFDTQLVEGVAQLLAAEARGTWNPTGIYAAGETGILLQSFPASPDRLIALSTYGVSDDPSLSDDVIGLQVRTRWDGQDPRPVNNLAAGVFDSLQGRPTTLLATGVKVTQWFRRSWVSLGQDENHRWSRSDNYYLTVHRPSTHRS